MGTGVRGGAGGYVGRREGGLGRRWCGGAFFFALIPDRPTSMLHLDGRTARRDGSVEEVDMRGGGAGVGSVRLH